VREHFKLRDKLTYANVMVTILAFIVLGGGAAFAALGKNTVGTKQLKRNSVKVGKIGPEAVKAGKMAKNSIATDRLRNAVVSGEKLANFAVTNPKIANSAVNQEKLAGDAIGGGQLKDIVTRQNAVNSAGIGAFAQTVQCAPGEQPISAGAELTNPNTAWLSSVTLQGGGARASARNFLGAPTTLVVFAYCLQS
jgi:hypothetical protein